MKKFIIFISVILSPVLNAHFFAYQEWQNPATGQILECYYDTHESKDPTINSINQRTAFIVRAQHNDSTLVLTEDMCSSQEQLNFNDTSTDNKEYIAQLLNEISYTTPLMGLSAHAFVNGIDASTIECRPGSIAGSTALPINNDVLHKIMDHKNPEFLHTFYTAIPEHAKQVSRLYNADLTAFIHNLLLVDANALHAITNSPHKRIMLAAGSAHIVSICNVLHQLGWIQGELYLPYTMSREHKKGLIKTLTEYTPDQAEHLFRYLSATKNDEIEEYHALDVANLSYQPDYKGFFNNCFVMSDKNSYTSALPSTHTTEKDRLATLSNTFIA